MGYQIRKDGASWALYLVEDSGKSRKQRYIAKKSPTFRDLGFKPDFTIDEARQLAKSLSAEKELQRRTAQRLAAQKRIDETNLIECAHLPAQHESQFRANLSSHGIRPDHWEAAKRLIKSWDRSPRDWAAHSLEFYEFVRSKSYSLNYIGTLRRTLNKWGYFYADQTGTPFRPIPVARQSVRMKLLLAYENYKGRDPRKRASGRLSFKLLNDNKKLFTEPEYNWLFIERAFGLRKEEMEVSLRSSKTHVIKGTILYVYQPKLERTVSRQNDRWKKIPALLPEQLKALDLIKTGNFKCPRSLKGLKDSAGRKLTWNCGRKDFYPAMVAAGYDRATVSVWLGHRDLSTARLYYDDPLDQSPFSAEDDEAA